MKILLTGGAGFIGSHVARRLMKEKYDVTIVDSLHRYDVVFATGIRRTVRWSEEYADYL
nr:NAD-dependent epimerase/dehydratase family protein [Bacillus mediterraneensis]